VDSLSLISIFLLAVYHIQNILSHLVDNRQNVLSASIPFAGRKNKKADYESHS